jgi:hypothetical protein
MFRGLEARIAKLESAAGIGTCRPWPAEWDGTPDADAALRRMLLHNPEACFHGASGMMLDEDQKGDNNEQPLQAG